MKKLLPSLLIAVLILFGSNVQDRGKEGGHGARNRVKGHKFGIDSIHFTNPSLSYDECENIFNSVNILK